MATCSGRLGEIVNRAISDYNDLDERWLKTSTASGLARVVSWANFVLRELARRNYFMKTGTMALVAEQSAYPMVTAFADFVRVAAVYWTEDGLRLQALPTHQDFELYSAQMSSGTRPLGWYFQSNSLHLVPTPSVADADGITVLYAYLPTVLDCTTNYTPPTPAAHDDLYYWYILHRAAQMDAMGGKQSSERAQYFYQNYLRELNLLLYQGSHPTSLEPY